MHAYSMKDPVFFTCMKDERDNNSPHGERFCIQCHSPPALVTENLFDIDAYATVEDFLSSNVPEVIKEGVTCDVCHSYTKLSQTVIASDDSLTNAKYHLYPEKELNLVQRKTQWKINIINPNIVQFSIVPDFVYPAIIW